MKQNILMLLCLLMFANVAVAGYPVNINTATAEEIAEGLDGVGLKKAQAIVDYRTQVGAYESADALVNVKGIGEKTMEKNREFVIISQENTAEGVQGQ